MGRIGDDVLQVFFFISVGVVANDDRRLFGALTRFTVIMMTLANKSGQGCRDFASACGTRVCRWMALFGCGPAWPRERLRVMSGPMVFVITCMVTVDRPTYRRLSAMSVKFLVIP